MKRQGIWKFTPILMLVLLLMIGCGAAGKEKRLGKSILIDGVDVSGLTLTEAERRVEEAHAYRDREEVLFRVVLGEHSVLLYAGHLPLEYNTEEVVAEAAKLSRWAFPSKPQRELQCTRTLDLAKAVSAAAPKLKLLDVPAKSAIAEYDPSMEGSFLFYQEQEGKAVSAERVLQKIAALIEKEDTGTVDAEFDPIPAEETIDSVRARYTLVSEFTSSYASSPLNASGRVHNIKKAAEMIDGYVLLPGDTFDMNAILGDRVEGKGWKKAPGIRDGKYEMEYGGGVCQVSSTLFNAVMMADLTVTERRPHSWPLSYIPIGRDATISTGGPNFKFKNGRDTPVVVSARTDAKEQTVTVRIYGAPLPNGMRIEIASERTGNIANPGNEIRLDESLPPETRVVERQSRAGKRSATYKDYYDADGALIERVTAYEDEYRAIKGIVYVSADLYQKD